MIKTLHILVNGEVSYSKLEGGDVGVGKPGDVFGHQALITEETRAATVTALSPVFCLTIGRTDFITLLGSLQDLINRPNDVNEAYVVSTFNIVYSI